MKRVRELLMVAPPVLIIAVFVGFPIVISLIYTLGHLGGPNSAVSAVAQHQVSARGAFLTFGAYTQVFAQHNFRAAIIASIWVTIVSVVIVLVLSWAIALFAWQTRSRLGRALSALAIVPMFIPVVIASYSILQFWSYAGFIKSVAHALGMPNFPSLGYSLPLVVLAEVWVSIPFGVLMISSGLSGIPASAFEAARDAGASMFRATRSILVPMNLLPTVIVTCFTGISILGSFTVPYLVGPTAPNLLGPEATATFQSFNEPQQAEVMAMVLFGLSIVVAVPYIWATYRSNRSTGAQAS
jgi:ABC-type spermidine/putrescine transport system permease subunit I